MNTLQWFYEMYSSGKMTLDMYKKILCQEIESKEKDLEELKKSLEDLKKDFDKIKE